MSDVVIISGNPDEISGTEQVLKYLGLLLIEDGFSIKHISVKDISPEVLCTCKVQHPVIQQCTKYIQEAKGIIIGSPVKQGSYSGVLKTFIDLLPPDIFEQKPVFPVMTGESPDYCFVLEYSFKPLLATLKGLNVKGIYLLDGQIDKFKENPILDKEKLQVTKQQLSSFINLIPDRTGKVIHFTDYKQKGNQMYNTKSRNPIN